MTRENSDVKLYQETPRYKTNSIKTLKDRIADLEGNANNIETTLIECTNFEINGKAWNYNRNRNNM